MGEGSFGLVGGQGEKRLGGASGPGTGQARVGGVSVCAQGGSETTMSGQSYEHPGEHGAQRTPSSDAERRKREEEFWERYLAYCRKRGVTVPAAGSVRGFLEHLALAGGVSASTQNQALNALVYFFGEGLGQELGELGEFEHAQRGRKLPVVLRPDEVERLLGAMKDPYRLMAELLG